jgi:hypothetical protein
LVRPLSGLVAVVNQLGVVDRQFQVHELLRLPLLHPCAMASQPQPAKPACCRCS